MAARLITQDEWNNFEDVASIKMNNNIYRVMTKDFSHEMIIAKGCKLFAAINEDFLLKDYCDEVIHITFFEEDKDNFFKDFFCTYMKESWGVSVIIQKDEA